MRKKKMGEVLEQTFPTAKDKVKQWVWHKVLSVSSECDIKYWVLAVSVT